MTCRFEDRLSGTALALGGLLGRIEARTRDEVAPALDAIEAGRRAGHWVALLLDYELGEWLLPETAVAPVQARVGADVGAISSAVACAGADAGGSGAAPRLTALIYADAERTTPWPEPSDSTARVVSVTAHLPQADYTRRIDAIRAGIQAGDFYQVNFTQPLDVRIEGDAQALYAQLASRHPSAHAAFIDDGTRRVLSFSPELFVAREGATLTTRPMKGTAPRAADPEDDAAQARVLQASEKNRAENVMIVDLLRNDLGRIATPGSVTVDALCALEAYPSVWTMTSTIRAHAPDTSLADVLRALFPCGSITGAPKVAAMRHIRRAERAPRGLYCGSVGWLAPNGDFSLNVAIRTLVLSADDTGVYGVGGGIVHDSDPAEEWQECFWKARLLGVPVESGSVPPAFEPTHPPIQSPFIPHAKSPV